MENVLEHGLGGGVRGPLDNVGGCGSGRKGRLLEDGPKDWTRGGGGGGSGGGDGA